MKKLTLLLTLLLAVSTPAFAGKGKAGKGAAKGAHPGKVLRELDKNGNHQIDGDEVPALKLEFGKAAADSLLKKLDIDLRAKRRLHLKFRVKFADIIFGENEVHRTNFARHRSAERLQRRDDAHLRRQSGPEAFAVDAEQCRHGAGAGTRHDHRRRLLANARQQRSAGRRLGHLVAKHQLNKTAWPIWFISVKMNQT